MKSLDQVTREAKAFCPRRDYQVLPRHAAAYSVVDRYAFVCDECNVERAGRD
jgi:hypothetical protein